MARRLAPPSKPLERRLGNRKPAPAIWVFCEGKTEKLYLEALLRRGRRTSVTVQIVGQKGVPCSVAQAARDKKRELEKIAKRAKGGFAADYEVWAVFDRDEHPNFKQAIEQCIANKVGLAWSNPCVELWALLHFRDRTAWIHRHACQRALAKEMPGYKHDRGAAFDVARMTDQARTMARRRALHLHRRADDAEDETQNPTTALWKLVDVLVTGDARAARALAQESNDGSAECWLPSDPGATPGE